MYNPPWICQKLLSIGNNWGEKGISSEGGYDLNVQGVSYHIYNYCGTIVGRFSTYCERKTKTKTYIPFLSLFIKDIICSIVREIQKCKNYFSHFLQ
jgi:hypothetical protein